MTIASPRFISGAELAVSLQELSLSLHRTGGDTFDLSI
jgi:hypothetical protein